MTAVIWRRAVLAYCDAWWTGIVAWLRTFADRHHHAKEETALFPAMVKAGVFPLADAVLDEQALRELRRAFDVVEAEQGVAATIAGAEAALGRLAAVLQVTT